MRSLTLILSGFILLQASNANAKPQFHCETSKTHEPSEGEFAELYDGNKPIKGWGKMPNISGPTGIEKCQEAIHCLVQTRTKPDICLQMAEQVAKCKYLESVKAPGYKKLKCEDFWNPPPGNR